MNNTITNIITTTQKYQPSANEKANRAQNPPVQGVSALPPRIVRSQSANDAPGVYGDYNNMYGDQYASHQDPRYYHGSSGAQTYTDPYGAGYDAYSYHQSAAAQAPDDPSAAYHQYYAQQAAMQQAQQQRSHTHLGTIYDNATYNAGYYNSPQTQHQRSPQQPTSAQGSPQQYDRAAARQRGGVRVQQQTIPKSQAPPSAVQQPPSQVASKAGAKTRGGPPSAAQPQYSSPYGQIAADYGKKDDKSKDNKNDGGLPSSPSKLKHAATIGDIATAHASYRQQSSDLRIELEQIQNKKELKRVELENKRKKLIDKHSLTMIAQKELEETKKKWNLEREEIIKSYGGSIPSFIIESDKLRKDLENMSNRNSALQASLEVISRHLTNELGQLQYQLKIEKEIAGQTHEHNIELERRVRELRIEKLELETELKTEKDKQENIRSNNKNNVPQKEESNNKKANRNVTFSNDIVDKFREYPPESTVIQNLLQAQVEFYFSDYNLKRDKRLLSDVVKPPKKGFLKLEEVMKLSRIRQLCSEIETLEEALRRSNILTLIRERKPVGSNNKKNDDEGSKIGKEGKGEDKKDDESKDDEDDNINKKKVDTNNDDNYIIWVGRLAFEKPREKEFPFRRTVFIFGIPVDGSEEFLHEMLKPFGSVSKIQFDHSPDGIDRKIGIRFLNKPRVYTLYYYDPNKHQTQLLNQQKINGLSGNGILDDDDELLMSPNREKMIFKTEYDIIGGNNDDGNETNKLKNIKCHKCGKDKSVSEGFYTTSEWKVIYCAQCAAQLAEDQLNVYYKERNIPQYQHNPRHKWLGLPPNDIQKRKTALVVFASQRQASKCAYVRTRIAYKGSFATHFHHYSKVKKEIVLSESDQSTNKNNDNSNDNSPSNNNKNQQNMKQNKNMQNQNNNRNNRNNQNNNNRNNKGGRNQNRNQQNRGYNRRGGGRNNNNNNYNNNNNNRRGGNRNYNNRNNQNQNQQQQQYGNYAQQQAQYYQGQSPPQSQQSQNKSKMKGPGLYRQSSAPTSH